jgi:hypothetical protein
MLHHAGLVGFLHFPQNLPGAQAMAAHPAARGVAVPLDAGDSCALMIAATASRYGSRNSDSPNADLNDRPFKVRSNHGGRGYEPVLAVGSIKETQGR